jgi:hypothetical protein
MPLISDYDPRILEAKAEDFLRESDAERSIRAGSLEPGNQA